MVLVFGLDMVMVAFVFRCVIIFIVCVCGLFVSFIFLHKFVFVWVMWGGVGRRLLK